MSLLVSKVAFSKLWNCPAVVVDFKILLSGMITVVNCMASGHLEYNVEFPVNSAPPFKVKVRGPNDT